MREEDSLIMPRTQFTPGTAVLETERLILRPLTPADLDDLAALYADPEVRRYFPEGTLDREETREELTWILREYYDNYGYGLWATILKQTGAFIGRCGLIPWDTADGLAVELAYLLGRPYWGQGLATEVARGIVDHAFNRLGLARLVCYMLPANQASARVAKKTGMKLERRMDGADGAVTMVYALHAGDRER